MYLSIHMYESYAPSNVSWGRRTASDEATARGPLSRGHLWPPSGAISEFPRHVTDKNVYNQGVSVVICGQISKYGNIPKVIDIRRFSDPWVPALSGTKIWGQNW